VEKRIMWGNCGKNVRKEYCEKSVEKMWKK
jgi:hypothetical protein